MRRRLGWHHAGGAPTDAPGLGGCGAGLSRFVVPTEEGPAAVELAVPDDDARALVVLGHGAGGGIQAPDLSALASSLPSAGFAVARVEQPYRAAGRRTPPAAQRLDVAWLTVVAELRARPGLSGRPLAVGGRSSGARVACRTAAASGAAAVVALAFPLRPPGRPASRVAELLAVPAPTLVVQGSRDVFGRGADFPTPLPAGMELVEVPGADHSFRSRLADGRSTAECLDEVTRVVSGWLRIRLGATPQWRG